MQQYNNKIDWLITLLPFCLITALSILFFLMPQQSNQILCRIRFFFGDTLGSYYLILGLGCFLLSLYLAHSKYGDIILGSKGEKPKHSFFAWGSMMFTCGLAADILFYSFSEWIMYATTPYVSTLEDPMQWAGVFPLFHWSFIPWSFYLVLAIAFGYMIHVRKRKRQRLSEACRPLLGSQTDGLLGRIIDLMAVFALLAGTATTFSVATPLMSSIIKELFNIQFSQTGITILILIITCMIYTYALLRGLKGISALALLCIYMYFGILAYVLLLGGKMGYIIDASLESFGRMVHHFILLATHTDPQRTTSFPQNWTIYYWAYWMVWCVAAPFFIGSISGGRSIRQIIYGGYAFGVGSTLLSFFVLGNYSMALQTCGVADFLSQYTLSTDPYSLIIDIISTLPLAPVLLVAVLLTMIAFYATSFDAIAYTASLYSYRRLERDTQPNRLLQFLWCILLILLPISLVFAKSSMSNLQTVSIVAAFPLGLIMILIILSFLKDARDTADKT